MSSRASGGRSGTTNQTSVRSMLPTVLGFVLLAGITLVLFALGVLEGFSRTLHAGVIMTFVLIGLAVATWRDWRSLLAKRPQPDLWTKRNAVDALSVVAGTLITYVLSVEVGLGAVVASALGGVGIALVLPSVAVPFYCGTFVGMISPTLVTRTPALFLAGVFGGIIYVIGKGALDGFGGKLGTTAYLAGLAAAVLCGRMPLSSDVPGMPDIALAIVYSVIGAAATWAISIRLKHGAVMASGAVGLLGGLVLPAIHPASGNLYAIAVFSATFAGMSSKERLPNELQVGIAGLICGATVAITGPYLGGAGGKLGTIAFGASIAVAGLVSLLSPIETRKENPSRAHGLRALRDSKRHQG